MELEVQSPDYVSGKVEGTVTLGSEDYTVRGTDYGSSLHVKIEGDDCSYSQTHNYSKVTSLETSGKSLEELFNLARDNFEAWESETEIFYVGEKYPDEITH